MEKSADGVIEIWTQDCWIIGADKSIEPWQPSDLTFCLYY